MPQELVVFWRLPNGTRCAVAPARPTGWELRVTRGPEVLLSEHFADPHALFARALALRKEFAASAA
jgi:hypothetical protein